MFYVNPIKMKEINLFILWIKSHLIEKEKKLLYLQTIGIVFGRPHIKVAYIKSKNTILPTYKYR